MTPEAISAGAAVIASLTAVSALWLEIKRTRFQRGVEMLLKFNDIFASEEMRKARRRAAEGIKEKKNEETDDVLDFFETIALLVRRGAINEFFVWHSFFYWIHRYRLLTKHYVASCRAEDHTIWGDLVWLHDRLIKVEKKQRHCTDADIALDSNKLGTFIEDESKV